MLITLRVLHNPHAYEIVPSDAYLVAHPAEMWQGVYVQTDYDYPGVASTFGWSLRNVARVTVDSERFALPLPCEHDGTDGTVTCLGCDTPASAFIESAAAFLDDHDGATADDPGYFGSEPMV